MKNKYKISNKTTYEIELSQGYLTTIDLDDLEKIINYGKWHAWVNPRYNNLVYGVTNKTLLFSNGKRTIVYLHRFIMNVHLKNTSKVVDHIDYNTLNNKKENLRLINQSLNSLNTPKLKSDNISGYRGVYWDKHAQKWIAQVRFNYKKYHLGCFSDFESAVEARKKAESNFWPEQHLIPN